MCYVRKMEAGDDEMGPDMSFWTLGNSLVEVV